MVEPTIKAKLVLDTGGGGGLSGSANGGGAGGLTGAVGGGKIAAGIAGIAASLVIIKQFMRKVVDSSPRLQQTMTIFNRSMSMLLRPIGDVMALWLKPLAIKMLRFAIPFYKDQSAKLKTTGGKIGGGVGLVGGAVAGGIGGAKLGGAIGTAIVPGAGTAVGAGIGGGLGAIAGGLLGGFLGINVGAKLEEWTVAIVEFFKEVDWAAIFQTMVDFFIVTIPEFFTETVPAALDVMKERVVKFFLEDLPFAAGYAFESIIIFFRDTLPEVAGKMWDSILKFFVETLPKAWETFMAIMTTFLTVTLPEAIIKAWDKIKTLFTETLPQWINTGFNKLKDFFLISVPNWVTSMIDKISSAFSSIGSFFKKGREKRKSKNDVIVTKRGDVLDLNPEDNIVAFKGNSPFGGRAGGGGSSNITINISALDASSIDSSLINKISSQIANTMKRELQGRSSYGVGI
jgi:hypothetical protein